MAVKTVEYLMSVDKYNKPMVVNDKEAVALNLVRLLLLNPGSDPFRPDMGVGLSYYRYAIPLDDLAKRIEDQINTYLPSYQNADINIIRTPDKVANIEITIGDTTYIYDSTQMPVSINLDLVKDN